MAHSRQAACSYQQEKFPTQNGSSKKCSSVGSSIENTGDSVSSGMAGTRHLNNFALLSLALAVFSGRFFRQILLSCSVG